MTDTVLPEILLITSYPPRECGIATYSNDLLSALSSKFNRSFKVKVCALESENEQHTYPPEVAYVLDTSNAISYENLALSVDYNSLSMVLLQHEFGFFNTQEASLLKFLNTVEIPVVITFHTVLPNPDMVLKQHVIALAEACSAIIVMTKSAAGILQKDYQVSPGKITVISHGTHLVQHLDKALLKEKYGFTGRTVLSTFGLISSGKNIETTIAALPAIVARNPDILFLLIGKTHPTVQKHEGETYRYMLETKVAELNLENHVQFVSRYQPLPDLLEYLQLTDIYLFTSKDPNQAVSGTFSYAISCACPIVSTRIPHALEVLGDDAGILIDFENSSQLSDAVIKLMEDEQLRKNISLNGLHRIAPTAWENTAIAHAMVFEKFCECHIRLQYSLPDINLNHIKHMSTGFGMIQFSKINHPDLDSGYTIDDNARALIAMCMQYEATADPDTLDYISKYLSFIGYCMQTEGRFLNYVDKDRMFTPQNDTDNLDDANGRAIWALGYLVSLKDILPAPIVAEASGIIKKALLHIQGIHSTRAVAFALKGLFYYHSASPSSENVILAETLGNRLERMYAHECDAGWTWFESYLTYGNSILPEAMLCAFTLTGNDTFRIVAKTSFDFLLSHTFTKTRIKLISNKSWLKKGRSAAIYGEQPIDVAYTVLALSRFYDEFEDQGYAEKMEIAFSWFLGNNHLHQVIYNPCTGGCYDGLEETQVNLNQGAESTVSYLMARICMGRHLRETQAAQLEMTQQA